MGLEDLTGTDKFIDDFNLSWPDGSTDQVASLDNHIFGIKNVLNNCFPSITGQVTSTHAELNLLAGSAAGTAAANKALVLGGSKNVDTIDVTALKLGGVAITATGVELNYLDVSTLGTAEASKALTADGSGITTGAILANTTLNGSLGGTGVLDEDDMASNSSTALATQQSIKAYVDNAVLTDSGSLFWSMIFEGGFA